VCVCLQTKLESDLKTETAEKTRLQKQVEELKSKKDQEIQKLQEEFKKKETELKQKLDAETSTHRLVTCLLCT